MEEILTALIGKFGSQCKAATALGITDRTFRNYVRKPDCVPEPMRRLMKTILEQEEPALAAQANLATRDAPSMSLSDSVQSVTV